MVSVDLPTTILQVSVRSVRRPACQPLKPSSLSTTAAIALSPATAVPTFAESATGKPVPVSTMVVSQFMPVVGPN